MRFGAFFFSWLGIAVIPPLVFAPEVDWRIDRPFSIGLEPPPQMLAAPVCYALSFKPPHAHWEWLMPTPTAVRLVPEMVSYQPLPPNAHLYAAQRASLDTAIGRTWWRYVGQDSIDIVFENSTHWLHFIIRASIAQHPAQGRAWFRFDGAEPPGRVQALAIDCARMP